jgi:hypothetical protein
LSEFDAGYQSKFTKYGISDRYLGLTFFFPIEELIIIFTMASFFLTSVGSISYNDCVKNMSLFFFLFPACQTVSRQFQQK